MNKKSVVRSFLFFCGSSAMLASLTLQADQQMGGGGEKIVGEVCSTCHGPGLMGAPKIGDTNAWQARLKNAGSVNVLLTTAEHGKGNMPPRGGESSLSDGELQSAIQYMLGKSGVTF